MTYRAEWNLFFAVLGCLLTIVVIALLLRQKHRHDSHLQGDIGPLTDSIDSVNKDAAANQKATLDSINTNRVEARTAAEGIRGQLEVDHHSVDLDLERSNLSLNWIKATIQRWFSTPPKDPPDNPGTPH